jgi:PAS domain S-box-containing protein
VASPAVAANDVIGRPVASHMALDPLLTTGPVEAKLRESQRTLATLMDNLPGMAYRCRNDQDWTMDFVSQGSMGLTGYTAAELVANTTVSYAQLIFPEDRARVDQAVQSAVAARGSFQIVYCITTKTGARRWVWEQGCGVFSKTGDLLALEGFITDITEAKRTEGELRGREAQLLEAQAIAHLGSWGWDIATAEMTGSAELRRIYGFGMDDVLTPSMIFERIHPDDADSVRAAVDAAMRGAPRFSLDHRIVRPSGEIRFFHVEGRVIRGPDGVPKEIIGAGQDVTARHEADLVAKALREEQASRASAEAAAAHDLHAAQAARGLSERGRARAEFLADATRILSSSFDTTTTLDQLAHLSVRFLDTCCAVALYGRDDGYVALVHSTGHHEAHSRRTVAEWKATADQDLILGERQRRGEAFVIGGTDETGGLVHGALLHALGARVLLSVPICVVGALMGSILFIGGPDRGEFSAEERSGAEELGRNAGVALQAAQMYHDALAATAARDEVLAVVAHDLRNPLSTIHMGSSLALELMAPEPGTPGRQQLEIISRTVKKMNQLIQDLLDTTRLQSGRLTLELAPSQPGGIIDEAVETLLPLASHAGIRLHAGAVTAVALIHVDRFRIQQVLSNLIGNALKFTPSGGSVAVSADQADGEVIFRVADTGQGIAADQLSQVFGRFWQAHRTDRRGLGLGLGIAQGIVEAHGGTIRVDSLLGAGTTFAFTIPALPKTRMGPAA